MSSGVMNGQYLATMLLSAMSGFWFAAIFFGEVVAVQSYHINHAIQMCEGRDKVDAVYLSGDFDCTNGMSGTYEEKR